MKVLVTGAAGFIGFHLVKALIGRGDKVVGIDNINDYYDVNLKYARLSNSGVSKNTVDLSVITPSTLYSSYSFQKIDVTDFEALEKLFENQNFDCVIHMAAQPGVRYSLVNPHAYVQSNLVGFINLLECCRHNKVSHFVYASSSSIYGENSKVPFSENDRVDFPVSLYAATKKSNELMAHTYSHLYHLCTTGLRFFTVYGPWGRPDMAPILFASAIAEGRPIKVFNQGNMSRDFTYIDDIVQGILLALDHPPTETNERPYYQIFNVGNGSPVSLMEFIQTLEDNLGKVAEKQMLPMQPGDVPQTWADTSELQALGYRSETSIKDGVKRFMDWFKTYNYNK